MKNNGKLYVLEGPDSVGKTSLANLLRNYLGTANVTCDLLSFPGRDPGTIGSLIYDLHHEPQRLGVKSLSQTALQMLHVAAHVDAIETKIRPSLEAGNTVILDRFWWSTEIYGQLGGLDKALLKSIIAPELAVWDELVPTAVFLVERNCPLEFGLTDEWTKCAQLYSLLSDEQEWTVTVHRIQNEGPINDTLKAIVSKLSMVGLMSAC
jgi:dTMP kinase